MPFLGVLQAAAAATAAMDSDGKAAEEFDRVAMWVQVRGRRGTLPVLALPLRFDRRLMPVLAVLQRGGRRETLPFLALPLRMLQQTDAFACGAAVRRRRGGDVRDGWGRAGVRVQGPDIQEGPVHCHFNCPFHCPASLPCSPPFP